MLVNTGQMTWFTPRATTIIIPARLGLIRTMIIGRQRRDVNRRMRRGHLAYQKQIYDGPTTISVVYICMHFLLSLLCIDSILLH